MEVDRNGLEVLGRSECLHLLGTQTIGRLGLSQGALPTILPVNYWFDGTRILVRTAPGGKLDAAVTGSVVAFEIDEVDPMYHEGWSVVAVGVAEEITDPAELAVLDTAPLARWAPRPDGHVVAIRPEIVTGRRLHRTAGEA